jgi:DNA adenine methylase
LRWTGSKRWFIKDHIADYLPLKFKNYHEPFLGGGAIFFYLRKAYKNKKIYKLSDTNAELINCYIQIRDNPTEVINHLSKFRNTEKQFYETRALSPKTLEKQAARLIYLNRTCFNGIYRVNPRGEFNVPYGHRKSVDIVGEEMLLKVSAALQNVELSIKSFEDTLSDIKKNDLVFIDPPYTVAHENNGFIEYNKKLFSWEDQVKLKEYIEALNKLGAHFILTNASHESISQLYSGVGSLSKLSRVSKVGGRNKTRGFYNELIIYNTCK